ncbi:MAG: D-glycero-alpha-D-manno-heptose-1,7-bisphosphate 7-phosphatase [Armatimonadota bacterium]
MQQQDTILARLKATSFGRAAVFFDRDGVLNEEVGYLHSPNGFVWREGAPRCIRAVNQAGMLAIVITNQGGIARSVYTEHDVRQLHLWMQAQLQPHHANLDAFYFCPHHDEGDIPHLSIDCPCRKPNPGMLLKAASQWGISLQNSIMLGDKHRDMQAASNAGVFGIMVDSHTLDDLTSLLEHHHR